MACRRLTIQTSRLGLNKILTRDFSQCHRTLPAVFHSLTRSGFSVVVVDHRYRVTVPVPQQKSIQQLGYSTSHYDKWTDLTYEDLVALLDSGDIQLFDVREQKEIQETGMIPGAVNIPLGDVKEAMKMEDARFTEHYKVAKPEIHDTNIVFYGLGPIKSSAALEIAHKVGYKKFLLGPVSRFIVALEMVPDEFKKEFGVDKPGEEDQNIVFNCNFGIRSKHAVSLAHELGFIKARHYVGGFDEWFQKRDNGK